MHAFLDTPNVSYYIVLHPWWNKGDGSCDAGRLRAKGGVASSKSVSVQILELRAAILALKMVHTTNWCFKSIDRAAEFRASLMIVHDQIHNVNSLFCIFIANRLTTEIRRQLSWHMLPCGEELTNGAKFPSLSERHWPQRFK